eukprot:scaffold15446_cov107-Isochrysis_galbana.AAC.2
MRWAADRINRRLVQGRVVKAAGEDGVGRRPANLCVFVGQCRSSGLYHRGREWIENGHAHRRWRRVGVGIGFPCILSALHVLTERAGLALGKGIVWKVVDVVASANPTPSLPLWSPTAQLLPVIRAETRRRVEREGELGTSAAEAETAVSLHWRQRRRRRLRHRHQTGRALEQSERWVAATPPAREARQLGRSSRRVSASAERTHDPAMTSSASSPHRTNRRTGPQWSAGELALHYPNPGIPRHSRRGGRGRRSLAGAPAMGEGRGLRCRRPNHAPRSPVSAARCTRRDRHRSFA